MKKRYSFSYNFDEATAVFEVDTDLYTEEHAKATLNFFIWDYDKDNDPIDEVMKKYAMEAIISATSNNYNKNGVRKHFEFLEGYNKIDGSSGILLVDVEAYEFNENDLQMNIMTTVELQ